MSTKKVRYAVIGAGNIAQVAVLPAFAHVTDTCDLVAIVSSDPEKRDALTEQYGVKYSGAYSSLEDVIEKARVDAAYIALPNHMHREYTERCAAKGVHVLCEKPMAMTSADCRAMIAACDAAKVKLMIAYRLHFEETNLRTVEVVKSGEIGEPRFFSSVFSHQVRAGDIRTQGDAGGGALFDLGTYPVNAARYLFQDEPTEVMAMMTSGLDRRFQEVDEMTTALLRFPGERYAQLTVNQGAADTSELRIVGTKGDVCLEPAYEYAAGLKQTITIEGESKERKFSKRDQFAPELEYFAQCVQHDVDPEPDGMEGLADVRILEAIVESARTGKSVHLPPFDRTTRPDMSQNIKKPPIEKPETVNAPSPSRS